MEKEIKQNIYRQVNVCSKCKCQMTYIYGEVFECSKCGSKVLSDFGRVKEFLEISGPQSAIIISESTGISIEYINKLLKEGRIEIPDGSDVYIQCQKCGTDIRYGRFCPDCMQTLSKNIQQAMLMPDVGEKPRLKNNSKGKMHTIDDMKVK